MANLYRLSFTSRSTLPPAKPDGTEHTAEIFSIARRRNSAAGITGAMAFCDGLFVEAIDGPQPCGGRPGAGRSRRQAAAAPVA